MTKVISWGLEELPEDMRAPYRAFMITQLKQAHEILRLDNTRPLDNPDLLFGVGSEIYFSDEVEEGAVDPVLLTGGGEIRGIDVDGWRPLFALISLKKAGIKRFGLRPDHLLLVDEEGKDLDVSNMDALNRLLQEYGIDRYTRSYLRSYAEALGIVPAPIIIESDLEDVFF